MKLTFHQQCAFTVATAAGNICAVDFGYEVPETVVAAQRKVVANWISHKHPDHLHRSYVDTLNAHVYAPSDVLSDLKDSKLSKSMIAPGSRIQIENLSFEVFAVDHGPGLSAPIENLGWTISAGSKKLLFLGDMAIPSPVSNGKWDAVLVPVGGSKVFTPAAAAEFIRSLGHTGITIPNHYHGRSDRTSGEQFAKLARSFCDVRLVNPGDGLEL